MKKLIIIIVAICGLQVGFSQEIDEITLNKMRVQLFSAQEQDSLGNYYKVLERIDKLEVLANGQKTEKGQNLKVKAYVGLEMFEKAKKELDILYSMGPSNAILKEISRYEIKIDDGIEEEKARKERARLAEIEREEKEKQRQITMKNAIKHFAYKSCKSCEGNGYEEYFRDAPCYRPYCKENNRMQLVQQGNYMKWVPCKICNGTGKYRKKNTRNCSVCNGSKKTLQYVGEEYLSNTDIEYLLKHNYNEIVENISNRINQ